MQRFLTFSTEHILASPRETNLIFLFLSKNSAETKIYLSAQFIFFFVSRMLHAEQASSIFNYKESCALR